MAKYQKRETIRNNLGKNVKIIYYHKDKLIPSLNKEETYEGVLSIYRFESTADFSFNGKFSFAGCINGINGIKFPILPLDGPLFNNKTLSTDNGYWIVEIKE